MKNSSVVRQIKNITDVMSTRLDDRDHLACDQRSDKKT